LRVVTSRHRLVGRVYGIPALLAILTMFGLLAALLGQGPWHGLSWLALSFPIVLAAWYATRRAARNGSRRNAQLNGNGRSRD
jgi:membrane protein implicated in regulation of membrane protease activity